MSDPTEHELDLAAQVFAHYLGVDLEEESDLIPIVRAAMLDVPQGWEVGVGKDDHGGIPYFYNEDTGESLWKHPRESQCRAKVEEARKLKQPKRNRSHRVFTETAREPRLRKRSEGGPDPRDQQQHTKAFERYMLLEGECNFFHSRIQEVRQRQELHALEAKMDSVLKEKTDLQLAVTLGRQLSQLPVRREFEPAEDIEELCRTLSAQHKSLITRVEEEAWRQISEEEYDHAESLHAKLEQLKALDLSDIAGLDTDPVWVDTAVSTESTPVV